VTVVKSLTCTATAQENTRRDICTNCMQGVRRQQLVLVDRAFSLLSILEKYNLKPDRPIWNSLIQCAGLSGQLTRAFRLLDSMTSSGYKPNSVTFLCLITSCNVVRPSCLGPAGMLADCVQERNSRTQQNAAAFQHKIRCSHTLHTGPVGAFLSHMTGHCSSLGRFVALEPPVDA
jgi:pentatricopeptide repeat protein